MSSFTCSNCGHVENIFGKDGAIRMCEEIGCDVLGDLPLVTEIQRSADSGQPISIGERENESVMVYKDICKKIIKNLGIDKN